MSNPQDAPPWYPARPEPTLAGPFTPPNPKPTAAGGSIDRDAPTDPTPRGDRLRAVVGIGLGVVVVALVGAALVGLDVVGAPSHPQAWDPRVADLVAFVEEERGLRFEQPVHVDFLSEDEFVEAVTTSEADLTNDDRAAIEDAVSSMRALGLVDGEIDLVGDRNAIEVDTTLAFYDPATERITVRGTELDPFARWVIVHELTHALQDQHFDLDAVRERVGDDGDLRFRAVVEGDASNVAEAYVAGLSAADRERFLSGHGGVPGIGSLGDERTGDGADVEATAGYSPVLAAYAAAPYAFGPVFIAAIEAEGGKAAVDRAIEHPPTSEAALFDPNRFLAGIDPEVVEPPTVDDEVEVLDDGTVGAFSWFVLLAARVDGLDALAFVDGWAGDRYVSYRDGDRVCIAARYRGTTEADAVFAAGVLDEWVASMPAGAASVDDLGDRVLELRSCDPGAAVAGPELHAVDVAFVYPVVRLLILTVELSPPDALPFEDAWCYADQVVGQLTIDQLMSDVITPEAERAQTDAARACRLD